MIKNRNCLHYTLPVGCSSFRSAASLQGLLGTPCAIHRPLEVSPRWYVVMVRHVPSLVNYARWVGAGLLGSRVAARRKLIKGDRKGSISTCVCFLPDMVQLWRICAVFFLFLFSFPSLLGFRQGLGVGGKGWGKGSGRPQGSPYSHQLKAHSTASCSSSWAELGCFLRLFM